MRARGRSAFTLAELLIVIAIIAVLAAMIGLSVTNAFKAGELTRCAANLHHLSQALSVRRSDSLESTRPEMKVAHWPIQLLPYVDFRKEVLICPASGSTERILDQEGGDIPPDWDIGGLDDWGTDPDTVVEDEPHDSKDLAELAAVRVATSSTDYYIPLQGGPMCLKLSASQYQDAWGSSSGRSRYGDHIRGKFDSNYRSDGSNTYWLCMEDYGSDYDFKDIRIRVTENDDGTYELQMHMPAVGHTNSLVTKAEHELLVQGPCTGVSVTLGEIKEVIDDENTLGGYESGYNPYLPTDPNDDDPGVFVTSYGMNAERIHLTTTPGRIALLDYSKFLARASDHWGAAAVDPNRDGVPIFARHEHHVNVLFTDGSVRTVHPMEIDPASPTNEFLYWSP